MVIGSPFCDTHNAPLAALHLEHGTVSGAMSSGIDRSDCNTMISCTVFCGVL